MIESTDDYRFDKAYLQVLAVNTAVEIQRKNCLEEFHNLPTWVLFSCSMTGYEAISLYLFWDEGHKPKTA